MQSFIQYRKWEKAVRAQYQRDKIKFAERFPGHARADAADEKEVEEARPNSQETVTANGVLGAEQKEECDFAPNSPDAAAGREETEHGEEGRNQDAASSVSDMDSSSISSDTSIGYVDNRETISRTTTQQSHGVNFSRIMTGIQVRTRTEKEGGDGQVFIVDFEGPNDPLNPHNWSNLTRWIATLNVTSIGWIVGFASSVDSGALYKAAGDFGVSDVTESLATGIFLIGFGSGALTAGPLSEEFGRNPVYIGTMAMYCIFIMASALSPNIGAQIAFRFIAGWFGATPLACAGGSVSDLWDSTERVFTFPIFANAAFMGPIFGPIVGGFIGQSTHLSWRWCEWVTLIVSGAILLNIVLFQPETYPPILLRWRAKHLRKITGDKRFRAAHEVRKEKFLRRLRKSLYRPFLILFQEPIAMLFGLYMTVIYIILFTFLNGYNFIFGDTYGFSLGITGLMFLGIAVGICLASPLVYPLYRRYKKHLIVAIEQGKTCLPPEQRLWFAMLGAPAIPISTFWMGWTANSSISYWSPLIASVLFGYGILTIFISCYQYLIDTYGLYAASALSAVTLVRYVASGGMVEVAIPMYQNLGVHWTLTIFGCISLLITPVPYLFYFYGHKIRSWSKFAQKS